MEFLILIVIVTIVLFYFFKRGKSRLDNSSDLKNGCISGNPEDCYMLGLGYYMELEYSEAIKYHMRACDIGHGNACAMLGAMYYEGRGVQVDIERSKAYHLKACQLGSDRGCDSLKTLEIKTLEIDTYKQSELAKLAEKIMQGKFD